MDKQKWTKWEIIALIPIMLLVIAVFAGIGFEEMADRNRKNTVCNYLNISIKQLYIFQKVDNYSSDNKLYRIVYKNNNMKQEIYIDINTGEQYCFTKECE